MIVTSDTTELVEIARSRVTRGFTDAVCQTLQLERPRYPHASPCADES